MNSLVHAVFFSPSHFNNAIMKKKKKAKPKTCTLVLAYVHKRVLKFPLMVLNLRCFFFFSSCTALIVYNKIIKTMVRKLVQMNTVFFVIRYSTGLEYFNLIARKLLMKINKVDEICWLLLPSFSIIEVFGLK